MGRSGSFGVIAIVRRGLVLLAVLALFAALSGCASLGARSLSVAFVAEDAAFIHKLGKATIRGKAFYQMASAKVLRAVGEDVYLIPRTTYSEAYVRSVFGDRKQAVFVAKPRNADPAFRGYRRQTISSTSGSFSFKRVADGDYYVVTRVAYPSGSVLRQYVWLMAEVEVAGGRADYVSVRGF